MDNNPLIFDSRNILNVDKLKEYGFNIYSIGENEDKYRIGVVGLGYVGLPLSIAFAKKYKVTGYDINKAKS